ncbi:MAG: hypothetical protein QW303_05855 [Nitrososphaerota archaeon]
MEVKIGGESKRTLADILRKNRTSHVQDSRSTLNLETIKSAKVEEQKMGALDQKLERSTIDRKIIVKQAIQVFDKKTLAYAVIVIRENIISRINYPMQSIHEHDRILMENFRKKFAELNRSWNVLMDFMLEKMKEIDDKYKSYNYFGLKERLLNEIVNISLSYIVIGPDANQGNGIDNLNGLTLNFINVKPTIRDKIRHFLHILPAKMQIISENTREIMELDAEHAKLLNEKNNIISQNEILKRTIKSMEHDRKKCVDDLDKIRNHISETNSKIQKIEEMITNIISKKNAANHYIHDIVIKIFSITNFSYFMHDDWFPQMDHNLLPQY